MPKLSIYVEDEQSTSGSKLLFKINVLAHITLRQLIVEIIATACKLSHGYSKHYIKVRAFRGYAPALCDHNGVQLWRGTQYTRSQMDLPIMGESGLRLRDKDALYIEKKPISTECDLSLALDAGGFPKKIVLNSFGKQEVLRAVEQGDIATIDGLLCLVRYYQQIRFQELFEAALKCNQVQVAHFLLSKFDINADRMFSKTNSWFAGLRTPLEYAAEHGHLEMVKLLISHGASLDPKYYELLSYSQQTEVTKYLLGSGAHPGNSIATQQYYYLSYAAQFFKAVLEASLYDKLNQSSKRIILQYVLRAHFVVNVSLFLKSVKLFYDNIFKPLKQLQTKTDRAAIKILLKNINFYLPPQLLKKQLLANHKKLRVITPQLTEAFDTILINLTLDRAAPVQEVTALVYEPPSNATYISVPTGHDAQDVIRYFIANYEREYENKKLHIFLAEHTHEITISMIIEALEMETQRFNSGAVLPQYTLLSKKLLSLKFGDDRLNFLAQQDKNLHKAVRSNRVDVVERLLSSGASLNTSIFYDYPTAPIHLAVDRGLEEMTQLLISYGADLSIKDKTGKTPLEYAHNQKHHHIQKLLIENGAYPLLNLLQDNQILNYARQFLVTLFRDNLLWCFPHVLLDVILEYSLNPQDYSNFDDFFATVTCFYDKEFQILRNYAAFATLFKNIGNPYLPPNMMHPLVKKHVAHMLQKDVSCLENIITAADQDTFNYIYTSIPIQAITPTLLEYAIDCIKSISEQREILDENSDNILKNKEITQKSLRKEIFQHLNNNDTIDSARMATKQANASLAICMGLMAQRFGGVLSAQHDEQLIKRLKTHAQQQLQARQDRQNDHPLFTVVSFLTVLQRNLPTSALPLAETSSKTTRPSPVGTIAVLVSSSLSSHSGPFQSLPTPPQPTKKLAGTPPASMLARK